jgi:hypothetical protein
MSAIMPETLNLSSFFFHPLHSIELLRERHRIHHYKIQREAALDLATRTLKFYKRPTTGLTDDELEMIILQTVKLVERFESRKKNVIEGFVSSIDNNIGGL